jgi:hypothetical protein
MTCIPKPPVMGGVCEEKRRAAEGGRKYRRDGGDLSPGDRTFIIIAILVTLITVSFNPIAEADYSRVTYPQIVFYFITRFGRQLNIEFCILL